MKLSKIDSEQFIKLMYIGNSSTGKTGSLTSLVKEGYKIRILDFDNGFSVLGQFVRKECPEKTDNVDVESFRDEIKVLPQGPKVIAPKAYVKSLKALEKWPSDESKPAEWGEDTILVVDSLTHMGNAAYAWAEGMDPTAKDKRQWYHAAQQSIASVLSKLTDPNFKTNVIVISHINYSEYQDGVTRGFPSSIGTAFGPKVPSYFNSLIMAQSQGSGKNARRRIVTVPTTLVDLKTPAPFKIEQDLPLESGLATIFKKLKDL